MNAPKTILEGIQFAKDNALISNQSEIDLFLHLKAISVTGVWKDDSFYVGAPELHYFKKKKFGALMKHIYNRSTTWFRNMGYILELQNGTRMYLHHGHANMVAYLGFSEDHKAFVLDAAKKRPTSNFHALLKSAGLSGSGTDGLGKEKESMWEKKYHKLKLDYDDLRAENKALKKENRALRRKMSQAASNFSNL